VDWEKLNDEQIEQDLDSLIQGEENN